MEGPGDVLRPHCRSARPAHPSLDRCSDFRACGPGFVPQPSLDVGKEGGSHGRMLFSCVLPPKHVIRKAAYIAQANKKISRPI